MEKDLERPSSLLVALDTGFDGCSILAADVVMQAHELFADEKSIVQKPLFVLTGQNETSYYEKAELINLSKLPGSPYLDREVYLNLVRTSSKENDMRLMAVTRDNVAFPLVSFARRKGSACDYIQIGEEMDDDSFIVVSPDHARRKDLIAEIQTLLSSKRIELKAAAIYPKSTLQTDIMTTVRSANQLPEPEIEEEPKQKRNHRLFGYFNLDEIIDARIGEFNPVVESVLNQIGKLAVMGKAPYIYQTTVTIDGGTRPTTVDIHIDVNNADIRRKRQVVEVKARPISMKDQPLVRVCSYVIDRTEQANLTNADASELNNLINPCFNRKLNDEIRQRELEAQKRLKVSRLPLGLGFLAQ